MKATGKCPKCLGFGKGDDDTGNMMPAICGLCGGTGKVTTAGDMLKASKKRIPKSVKKALRRAVDDFA